MKAIMWSITLGMLVMVNSCSKHSERSSYINKAELLTYPDRRGNPREVNNAAQWNIRRGHVLNNIQMVMGKLPEVSAEKPIVKLIEEEELENYIRRKIHYYIEADDYVPAYLMIPKNIKGKVPGVLCLHQTHTIGKDEIVGLGGNPDLHYAMELTERGYVTISPDYMYLGENKYDPYKNDYPSAILKGIINHRRAIDILQSLDFVDSEKIGCIGHSLGDYNALFLSAFDERIKVVVSSCGFTSFYFYNDGDLTVWASKYHMPRVASVYHNNPEEMPFDFPEVLAAIAPRPLFVNAPVRDSVFEVNGVKKCMSKAEKIYTLLGVEDKLRVVYPDEEHSFTQNTRLQAYGFIDKSLITL